ncbi:unnamed protein product [Prorocentrum cordatum]|uniref:Uncharacterized protein n=1 Tax=Prorocentrum cordatum TaxID=2364126 RepID=A0ABN9YIV8_9DINO|nr:unnamed protein product [Polarella glacialis]
MAIAQHAVLMRNDGVPVTMGSKGRGQCDVPKLPRGVVMKKFATGVGHTLYVRSDGAAVGVGANDQGQTLVPALPAEVTYTEVSGGPDHIVLLRSDGSAVAFGGNRDGQCDMPILEGEVTYKQASAGGKHTVLLCSDGCVATAGANDCGQCDIPDLSAGVFYTQVACGSEHTVMLCSDGQCVSMGSNAQGQLNIPQLKPSVKRFPAAATPRCCSAATALRSPSGPTTTCHTASADDLHVRQRRAGAPARLLLRSDGKAVAVGDKKGGHCKVPDPPGGGDRTRRSPPASSSRCCSAVRARWSLSEPTAGASATYPRCRRGRSTFGSSPGLTTAWSSAATAGRRRRGCWRATRARSRHSRRKSPTPARPRERTIRCCFAATAGPCRAGRTLLGSATSRSSRRASRTRRYAAARSTLPC